MSLAILAAAALIGGLITARLRMPAGALLGALAGTVLVQSLGLTALPPAPPLARGALYTAIGLMLGLRFTRESMSYLRNVRLPAVLIPAVMVLSGLSLGLLYSGLTPDGSRLRVDVTTGVLALTPGGFQEMSIAAEQMNAVLSVVVFSHLVRIITVLGIYPRLIDLIARRLEPRSVARNVATAREPVAAGYKSGSEAVLHTGREEHLLPIVAQEQPTAGPEGTRALQWGALISAAVVGGLLGWWSRIPAGTVVVAMLAVIGAKLWLSADSASVPSRMRVAIRMGLGINLGLQFAVGPLVHAGSLALPLALSLVLLMLISVVAALVVWRATAIDLPTALWMSAPAGLTEIAVLAEEGGVDPLPVLTVHLMRVVLIIAVQPTLVLLLTNLL